MTVPIVIIQPLLTMVVTVVVMVTGDMAMDVALVIGIKKKKKIGMI